MYATDSAAGSAVLGQAPVISFSIRRPDQESSGPDGLSFSRRLRRSILLARRKLLEMQSPWGDWAAAPGVDTDRIESAGRPSTVDPTAWSLIALLASGLPADQGACVAARDRLAERTAVDELPSAAEAMPAGELAAALAALKLSAEATPESCAALPPNLRLAGEAPADVARRAREYRAVSVRYRLADRLRAVQNADGSWGEADADSVATTGLALEALVQSGVESGVGRGAVEIKRGAAFLVQHLRRVGSWRHATGEPDRYAAWLALAGLTAAGTSTSDAVVIRAARWLADEEAFVTAEESPLHAAWSILGLLAAGRGRHPATIERVGRLLESQTVGGGWESAAGSQWRAIAFPLLALSRWAVSGNDDSGRGDETSAPCHDWVLPFEPHRSGWAPSARRVA